MTTANSVNTYIVPTATREVTMPLQPAFLAFLSAIDTNVTGASTEYTFGTTALTEVYDQNADFNVNGTFTAPVTGRYMVNASLTMAGCTIATFFNFKIVSSNRTYWNQVNRAASALNQDLQISSFVDMDTADTFTITITAGGEAADTIDITGDATILFSFCSCSLTC